MRIVREAWRLLSISRSKHFMFYEQAKIEKLSPRASQSVYSSQSVSVQQMVGMQGIHCVCSDGGCMQGWCRVHRGRAAEHGARLSRKPRRRVLSSKHGVRSGDGSQPTPTPSTTSIFTSPR